MSKQKENDNDISSPNLIIEDVTPVDGIPEYLLEELTPDTAKIITSEASTATRIDNAYVSGFNEGFIHGQIKLLEIAHDILIRAGNSPEESTTITKIIANHAGIINQYRAWLLTHKNNY